MTSYFSRARRATYVAAVVPDATYRRSKDVQGIYYSVDHRMTGTDRRTGGARLHCVAVPEISCDELEPQCANTGTSSTNIRAARTPTGSRALGGSRTDRLLHAICGMDPSLPRARAKRLIAISDDVHTRLRRICAEMPTPLFNAMVERIALVQLKYEKDLFLSDRIWT